MPDSLSRTANIRWGIQWGMTIASIYSLIALVINRLSAGQAFSRKGITLGQTIALYMISGLIGGIVIGSLRPVMKSKLGASAVGVIAAFPLSVGISVMRSGAPSGWNDETWVPTVITAVVFGIIGAQVFWSEPSDP